MRIPKLINKRMAGIITPDGSYGVPSEFVNAVMKIRRATDPRQIQIHISERMVLSPMYLVMIMHTIVAIPSADSVARAIVYILALSWSR